MSGRLAAALLASGACVTQCFPAQADVPAPPAATTQTGSTGLDKSLVKELAKGSLLDQLEKRGRFPKTAFKPSDKLIKPYATAPVGASIAYQMVQGTEFVDAPAAQKLSQDIVDRLLEKWKGPKERFEVRIVASPYYHAEATPTGLILVSLGTFNPKSGAGAPTVEELSVLLGHELAHLLLRHVEGRKGLGAIGQALNIAAGGALLYSSASNSKMVGREFKLEGDPKLFRKSLITSLATTTLLQDLLAPGFDRGEEMEADRLGVDLARRAGYNVTATEALGFIDHHSADQTQASGRLAALATLVTALNAEVAARTAKATGGRFGPLVDSAINDVGSKAVGALGNFVVKQTASHPKPEERRAFLNEYCNKLEYFEVRDPEGRPRPRNVADMSRVANAPAMIQLLAAVSLAADVDRRLTESLSDPSGAETDKAVQDLLKRSGFSARTARTVNKIQRGDSQSSGKAKRGTKAAQSVVAPTGFADENAPYTNRIQGMLQRVSGDASGARTTFQRGLGRAFAAVPLVQQFAETSREPGLTPDLDAVISRYGAALGTTDPLLDLAVASAVAKGDVAAAEVATARCYTYDNGRLYTRCAAFLGYDPTNKTTPAQTEQGKAAFFAKPFEKFGQSILSLKDLF